MTDVPPIKLRVFEIYTDEDGEDLDREVPIDTIDFEDQTIWVYIRKQYEVKVNDLDMRDTWSCGICGDDRDHDAKPHSDATGDGLTRYDIIDYLDGRKLRG